MARRLAATFAVVTLVALLVVGGVAALTDGPVAPAAAAVVALAGSAVAGTVVGRRLTASYSALVRRDQAVTVAASHQLRTPITALRLSLEDLTLWKDVPQDVADELHRSIGELDRLSDAVTDMLDQHRQDHRDGLDHLDLTSLTTAAVDRWRPTIDPARSVRLEASGAAHVLLDAATVGRVITTQLDQFDGAGTGDVTIEVSRVGRTVRVRVQDQSGPRFAPGVIHGPVTGKSAGEVLTLEEAGGLAESLGGYLAVEEAPTTCLSLILPALERRRFDEAAEG